MRDQLCTRGNPGGLRSLVTAMGPIYMPDSELDADDEPACKRARGRAGTGRRARKPTGKRTPGKPTPGKPTGKRKAEEEEDEDAMDEEEEDAMDEEQWTGPTSPMAAREMEAAVEETLNMLFAGDRNDVPFDELYSRLIRKEPRAIRAGRKAVEEALFAMEAAQKVMYREGVIHLI